RHALRYPEAAAALERALGMAEASGDEAQLDLLLITAAQTDILRGRWAEAEAKLARVRPDLPRLERSYLLVARGEIARGRGDQGSAARRFGQALRLRARLADKVATASVLVSLLRLAAEAEDHAAAERWMLEAVRL